MKNELKPAYQTPTFDLATEADYLMVDLVNLHALFDAMADAFFDLSRPEQAQVAADDAQCNKINGLYSISYEQSRRIMTRLNALKDALYQRVQEERAEA